MLDLSRFRAADGSVRETSFVSRIVAGAGFALLIAGMMAVPYLAAEPAAAESSLPAEAQPSLLECTPEQVNATQRWWLFGRKSGLDFGLNGSTPSTIVGNPYESAEGTTVVSNAQGELQFWSNSGYVFNRNNAVMLNGSGLLGNSSATQVVASFPAAGKYNQYFVVTTNANAVGFAGQLRYSLVDMNADNGLGGVVAGVKNITLGASSSSAEGLTAVPNATGDGFWVLTWAPSTNKILAYEFDGEGPKNGGAPVVSTLPEGAFGQAHFGSLQAYLEPDRTRIVQIENLRPNWASTSSGVTGMIRVYDFDAASGVYALQYAWESGNAFSSGGAYTADFSPEGKYIYANTVYGGTIYRYTLDGAGSSQDVKASEAVVGRSRGDGGMIRRGPDGRMYSADNNQGYLGVVNEPDAVDVSEVGWNNSGVALPAGQASRYGLPQFVTGCPTGKLSTAKTGQLAGPIEAGGTVNYTIRVNNTGIVPVTDAYVSDFGFTGSGEAPQIDCPGGNPVARIDPGESISCTATYVLTAADLDAGFLVNKACAVGTDLFGRETACLESESRVTLPQWPSLSIVKTVTPNTPTEFQAGQQVTYDFKVVNTGNVTVHGISINETAWNGHAVIEDILCPEDSLAAGDSMHCVSTYTLTQPDIDGGDLENEAIARGLDPAGEPVESKPDDAIAPGLQVPSVRLEKVASPKHIEHPGVAIHYSYIVENTGNVTLTELEVNEIDFSGIGTAPEPSCEVNVLAPNESTVCHAWYEVGQADFDRHAEIVNTAQVVAAAPDGDDVLSELDSAVVTLERAHAMTLLKSADVKSVDAEGTAISYSFHVTNTGNVTIGEIRVDELSFNGHNSIPAIACPVPALLPGEDMVCSTQYQVSSPDIESGQTLTNTAAATGVSVMGETTTEPSTFSVDILNPVSPPTEPTPPAAPNEPDHPQLAQTGSDGNTGTLATLLMLAAAMVGVARVVTRRQRRSQGS